MWKYLSGDMQKMLSHLDKKRKRRERKWIKRLTKTKESTKARVNSDVEWMIQSINTCIHRLMVIFASYVWDFLPTSNDSILCKTCKNQFIWSAYKYVKVFTRVNILIPIFSQMPMWTMICSIFFSHTNDFILTIIKENFNNKLRQKTKFMEFLRVDPNFFWPKNKWFANLEKKNSRVSSEKHSSG